MRTDSRAAVDGYCGPYLRRARGKRMLSRKESIKPSDNPVFGGSRLDFPRKIPEGWEKHIVFRPRDTVFNYTAWPSVCCDENGTLYAVSCQGTDHVCPFGRVCMFVSKNGGRSWSPPILVQDSYIGDGHGGILYLGNGRLILSWAYHPGDVLYYDEYNRITGTMWGGTPDSIARLRGAMLDVYPDLPPEKLVGGSFVKVSEDYGMTWSEAVRLPVAAPHGPAVLADGTLQYLGKEFYASTQGTFDVFALGKGQRVQADTWEEYVVKLEKTRQGRECSVTPVYAYASSDEGVTWERRGICEKPEGIPWHSCQEPHVVQLTDGSLLGAIRVEDDRKHENEMAVYLTRSADGGMTWTPWECTHINGGPPHLLQHSSGAIVLTVGRRTNGALGEYALVSHDCGATWDTEYCLDDRTPDNDLGYPCTAELPDGSLVTVYYQHYVDPETGKADHHPSIQCVRWKLQ